MSTFYPWQFFVITVAGWINRNQQDVIDYLVAENRVLKGQLRGKRVHLTDDERRRLAVKGKVLGRKLLEDVATIVTPDTIIAWYRKLIARKKAEATPRLQLVVRFHEGRRPLPLVELRRAA